MIYLLMNLHRMTLLKATLLKKILKMILKMIIPERIRYQKNGNPTKIRQAEYYKKYTEVVYDVDGNELVFTILPDMTIFNIMIDYKN